MATYLDPGLLNRELQLAQTALRIAQENPGDDRYNLAREQSRVNWLLSPSYCAGSTEDEILAAHEGRWQYGEGWDLARHKEAKNPGQCEAARQYDLATDKWYREAPLSLLKNLGAGIINGIVPGSDLGDAGSSTQILGQLIGGGASLFINPGALATSITKSMSLSSTIGNAINFAAKTFSGPIGSIATTAISSLLTPRSAAPMPAQVQQQIYSSAQPLQIADARPLSFAQQQIFGPNQASQLVIDTTKGTVSKSSGSFPLWGWLAIGAAVIAALLAVFIPRKRRRK